MEILLGLVLLTAVFALLGYPLYRARPRALVAGTGALGDLVAQRDGLYATLRDLDLDFELGKLDRGDYQTRREKYLARATLVLKQLDLIREEGAKASSQSEEIEREVAVLRRTPAAGAESDSPVCPNCGRAYNEGDRFCGRCGNTLP